MRPFCRKRAGGANSKGFQRRQRLIERRLLNPQLPQYLLNLSAVPAGTRFRLADGDSAVARLLGDRKPRLMVTDPPYGIELDSEWRDRAGLNGHGAAEPSYMKKRTKGHSETTISGDTRADWSG